jgi:hypothetical protein
MIKGVTSGSWLVPQCSLQYKLKVLHAVLAGVVGFGDASNLELHAAIVKAGLIATTP